MEEKTLRNSTIGIIVFLVIYLIVAIYYQFIGNIGGWSVLTFLIARLIIKKLISKGSINHSNAFFSGFFVAFGIKVITLIVSTIIISSLL